MNDRVRISVLCDDQAKMSFMDRVFRAEHGLSLFVEVGETLKILFDVGATDVFLHNAALLQLSMASVDLVVLSHGHWDHSNGLRHLSQLSLRPSVLVHPDAFVYRCRPTGEYNGLPFDLVGMGERFHLTLSEKPYPLAKDVWFLGEIPRVTPHEAKETKFHCLVGNRKIDDFLRDDSALAIKTARGLIVLSGCSHAGICNIVEYAKEVARCDAIFMVMGGFHLLGNSSQLQETVGYFSRNPVTHLLPMHCTNLEALCAFHRNFGSRRICAGDVITVE
ncbi:MAG: MBL fold metallo-hydrolase [Deltaproteobacteria bacterium]|nr:MBL fold metallo-hydrolase [Deltaproteobacteria bacterium]